MPTPDQGETVEASTVTAKPKTVSNTEPASEVPSVLEPVAKLEAFSIGERNFQFQAHFDFENRKCTIFPGDGNKSHAIIASLDQLMVPR